MATTLLLHCANLCHWFSPHPLETVWVLNKQTKPRNHLWRRYRCHTLPELAYPQGCSRWVEMFRSILVTIAWESLLSWTVVKISTLLEGIPAQRNKDLKCLWYQQPWGCDLLLLQRYFSTKPTTRKACYHTAPPVGTFFPKWQTRDNDNRVKKVFTQVTLSALFVVGAAMTTLQ